MTDLRETLSEYLSVRRSLGYHLVVAEHLLEQFLDYLEANGAIAPTTARAIKIGRAHV